jgi:tryptophan synthase alpha chain
MTRLRALLEGLRLEGRAALVPYLTAGDPDLDRTAGYARALADGGADLVELGIPFSDPLADGPVLQRAAERALAAGTRVAGVLECAGRIAAAGIPVVLMTYANPVLRWGWERFARDAAAAGVLGIILTDVPPEEAGAFVPAAAASDLGTVFLAAPTSGEARLAAAIAATTGFLYCVSRLGVTGERASLSAAFRPVLERVRALSDVPVGLGFGISTAEHAREAARLADAVIVGSRLVALAEDAGAARAASALRGAATELRRAVEGARA